jgi:hypothetical protein
MDDTKSVKKQGNKGRYKPSKDSSNGFEHASMNSSHGKKRTTLFKGARPQSKDGSPVVPLADQTALESWHRNELRLWVFKQSSIPCHFRRNRRCQRFLPYFQFAKFERSLFAIDGSLSFLARRMQPRNVIVWNAFWKGFWWSPCAKGPSFMGKVWRKVSEITQESFREKTQEGECGAPEDCPESVWKFKRQSTMHHPLAHFRWAGSILTNMRWRIDRKLISGHPPGWSRAH